MKLPARIAAIVAVVVAAAIALGSEAPAAKPKPGRLQAFSSCGALLHYVKGHAAPFVTAYGVGKPGGTSVPGGAPVPAAAAGGSSGAEQGVDFSGTNDKEAGVDEPDLVRTTGSSRSRSRTASRSSSTRSTSRAPGINCCSRARTCS